MRRLYPCISLTSTTLNSLRDAWLPVAHTLAHIYIYTLNNYHRRKEQNYILRPRCAFAKPRREIMRCRSQKQTPPGFLRRCFSHSWNFTPAANGDAEWKWVSVFLRKDSAEIRAACETNVCKMNKWLFSFDARLFAERKCVARTRKTFNLTLWCRGDLIKLSEQRDTITQSFLFLAAPACLRPKKNALAIFFSCCKHSFALPLSKLFPLSWRNTDGEDKTNLFCLVFHCKSFSVGAILAHNFTL